MAEKPNILIAVPCYGGSLKLGFFRAFNALTQSLNASGVDFTVIDADKDNIAHVRNCFGSFFHQEKKFNLWLSIDNDMTFTPQTISHLIASGHPIIGCVARRRSQALAINVRHKGVPTFNDGIAAVDGIGAGILLIRRDAIEAIAQHVTKDETHEYKSSGLNGPLYGFFDQEPALSEDYSFCHRAKQLCGIQSFALLDPTVGHIGETVYQTPDAL